MILVCFKRYKNTQGIRYHYQHYDHDSIEETGQQVDVPEVVNLESKEGPAEGSKAENVETSAYCDFCLGDARENKKTGIKEELISCSDCGRSGRSDLFMLAVFEMCLFKIFFSLKMKMEDLQQLWIILSI